MNEEFYRVVNPKYCLWPTPGFFWDNNKKGQGKDSGPWETLEVRAWMDKLNVEKHYVAKDGLQQIDIPVDYKTQSPDKMEAKHSQVSPTTIIPAPKTVKMGKGDLALGKSIVIKQAELQPLATIVAEELYKLSGKKMSISTGEANPGDIVLSLDDKLTGEAYRLEVQDRVSVLGGNYNAVAMGTVSLLQALSEQDGMVSVPRMSISDEPATDYRGLLVDVARKPHSIQTLEDCIELCRWYKIRYLQLHLTDDQLFTFPSTAYPKLATPGKSYTLEQLRGLEEYAKYRGVTIIPEFDVPGHAGSLLNAMPELFGVKGARRKGWSVTMNFAKEEVCQAVETIIEEMLDVFQTTPYFHIGADESNFTGFDQDPDFQKAYQKLGITGNLGELSEERAKSDNPRKLIKPEEHPKAYELSLRFISRMNDKVKSCGKTTLIWEGFSALGADRLPKDMIVMPYHMRNIKPSWLVEEGFTLINASSVLYVIGGRKHPDLKTYYDFSPYHFKGRASAWRNMDLPSSAPVLGAQLCSWEQTQDQEIPTLRKRLALFAERLWNPESGKGFDELLTRLNQTDGKLNSLISGKTNGRVSRDEIEAFEKSLKKPAEYK